MSEPDQISNQELSILNDQHFLLTKRMIDSKVTNLLLSSQQAIANHIEQKEIVLPPEVSIKPRKISKGENYASLPYWVSDFPTIMQQNDIWSFRTVVWWGNEISFSLILKGRFKPELQKLSITAGDQNLFYSTHTDPWKLELTLPNAIKLHSTKVEKIRKHFDESNFIKLSEPLPLNDINQLPQQSVTSFDKILKSLKILA